MTLPNGSRQCIFAAAYDKFPFLRIYQKNGDLLYESRYLNGQEFPLALVNPNSSQKSFGQIMQNYRKIKSTTEYIYALYIGKTTSEMTKEGVGLDDFSNEIHVWDWLGNPIQKILLDRNIFSFCVANNNKYLICSSLNSIDKLYKYKLQL
ncbi:MAG: BF3164 family lipoprotein [Bacteroidota bacterium]|nr:BF3164 family lipoprotein [Bacteroidota bacterium]